jgi:hypothetical protein
MELSGKDIIKMNLILNMKLSDVLDYMVINHFSNNIEELKEKKSII